MHFENFSNTTDKGKYVPKKLREVIASQATKRQSCGAGHIPRHVELWIRDAEARERYSGKQVDFLVTKQRELDSLIDQCESVGIDVLILTGSGDCELLFRKAGSDRSFMIWHPLSRNKRWRTGARKGVGYIPNRPADLCTGEGLELPDVFDKVKAVMETYIGR